MRIKKRILNTGFLVTIILLAFFSPISGRSIIDNKLFYKQNEESNPDILNRPLFTYCSMLKMMFLCYSVLYIFFESIDNENMYQQMLDSAVIILEYGKDIGCWDEIPPPNLKNEINLTQQLSDMSKVLIIKTQVGKICSCEYLG